MITSFFPRYFVWPRLGRVLPTTVHITVRSLFLLLALSVAGCGLFEQEPDFDAYTGIWEQAGYGRIWQFGDGKLKRYEHNTYGCLQKDEESLKDLAEQAGHFHMADSKRSFELRATSAKPQYFVKLERLPASCAQPLTGAQPALVQFDYFWHALNDYYAFFAERGPDWSAVYRDYRPRIAAARSEAEVRSLYAEIMALFADARLGLKGRAGTEFHGAQASEGLAAEVLRSPLVLSDDPAAFAKLRDLQRAQADAQLLPGSRQSAGELDGTEPALSWGRLKSDIGYLRIGRLAGICGRETKLTLAGSLRASDRETTCVHAHMQRVKQDLAGTRAMVLDLRFAAGSDERLALSIASHFAAQPVTIGEYSVRASTRTALPIKLTPATTAYIQPLFVLTSRDTAFAPELMALALRALPQTTLLGAATAGNPSELQTLTLPNGWALTLANQRTYDREKLALDGPGLPPELPAHPYGSLDYLLNSATPIDYALQSLAATPNAVSDDAALDAAVDELRTALGVPGLAVAVIKDGSLRLAKGYGLADREAGRPVTADTPFQLASISKTFIGSYLMQQVERGTLELDRPLDPQPLGFSVDSPLAGVAAPTLRQLATHASGIHDRPEIYQCNYFLAADGSSLLNLMLGNAELCPPPQTEQSAYLSAYLSNTGSLYDRANFNEYAPGLGWDYSNIGAALAGHAIERITAVALPEGMQQSLFEPLGMTNTAWRKADLPGTPGPARLYTQMLDPARESPPLALPDYSYPDLYSGGLWSSVSDLARYQLAMARGGELDGHRVLSAQSVALMLADQAGVPTPGDAQGLFWRQDGSFIGHTGSDLGTDTVLYYHPQTKIGIVLLANSDSLILPSAPGQGLDREQPYFRLLAALYRYGLGLP